MKLLIIVINKLELLEDILSILVEVGITEATILDSEGMGQFLAYEVPIFAGLRRLTGEKKGPSKTILSLLEDKEIVSQLKRLLKEEDIDFTQPGTGMILTLPVDIVIKSGSELS